MHLCHEVIKSKYALCSARTTGELDLNQSNFQSEEMILITNDPGIVDDMLEI